MNFIFQPKRVIAVAKKEIFHIVRDPFTLTLAIVLPMIMVTVFGLAIDFNVRDIRLSVFDGDQTQASRVLTETFESSRLFQVRHKRRTLELLHDLDSEQAKVVLIIERGFERDLKSRQQSKAQVILDGADNSTAGIILGYIGGIQRAATFRLTEEKRPDVVEVKTRFLFNPELNSSWFVVPGLAVVVIAILSVLLTSLTIAREWENGSMELLLSSPIQPLEIIAGKLAPYTFLGLSSILFVYLAARLGFGVPFVGNHLLFLAGSLIFLSTCLSQGLLISVVMRRQQLAMQIAIITGLLPSILLSGFIFPVESMPIFFQYFTSILPSKWFMMISRGIFLKGTDFISLLKPFGALVALNGILLFAATRRFKKDLEP